MDSPIIISVIQFYRNKLQMNKKAARWSLWLPIFKVCPLHRSSLVLINLILYLGKEIICTKTAWAKFCGIVKIVGGPREQKRADEWEKKIRIVEDQPSKRMLDLKGPKINQSHRIIFGTADSLQAVTTTANISLVRSCEQQGLRLAVFVHPARALTEQKAEMPPVSAAAISAST